MKTKSHRHIHFDAIYNNITHYAFPIRFFFFIRLVTHSGKSTTQEESTHKELTTAILENARTPEI